MRDGAVIAETGGSYGLGGARYIRQAFVDQLAFDGNTPVIGSWVVGDQAHGLGIREDAGLITSNASRFVPHTIID